ncbi:LacI family DNA-binding transcriptional regulator [Rhizobium sp. SSA_523]|uniref:LacI family DNA-binding transcriptional regulator n=1 Tax=Rhizobium sp. SSA_523 TaxID=2952477 RepID=UPI0020918DEF|nr:LacI family DNA-binding transcriptional regulator [Rhizobium sp. SSA_523]MCO5733090.1 LacI family DNA-binding transcriptional regulator [Rhizobium sp. SSA_523]WKC23969.1 LacI family DNA-binding transcriptional regulator [Rhizobium sp. SSA_523]
MKNGKYRMRFVSAEQVALSAGVSRSAVSRTFTPGASVSQETREKVLRAAEELGYHVNDLARGVLNNQSRLVGIVATRPEVGFRAHLTAALSKALIRRGSVPVLINTGQREDELLAAQKMLIGHRAEATIILSGSPPASFFDLAKRNGQPVVLIGRSEPDADHLDAGNSEASIEAARLFLRAGREKLAFAGPLAATPAIQERQIAFLSELEHHGRPLLPFFGGEADYQCGLSAGRAMLAEVEPPDAVFCGNDLIAFGVMDVLRREGGLRVPDDVAVIGFDDIPEAAWLNYGLTTFRQDPLVMAQKAVDFLDRRLAEPEASPGHERVVPDLVIRQSFDPKSGAEVRGRSQGPQSGAGVRCRSQGPGRGDTDKDVKG